MDQALSNEDYALLDFSFPEADWKPSAGDPGELAYLLRNIPSIENIADIVATSHLVIKHLQSGQCNWGQIFNFLI